MRAVRIETSPFQILSLVEFESILKKNQHGCAKISGYISAEEKNRIMAMISEETWAHIWFYDETEGKNILFIDDSIKNIDAARELGWNVCNATGDEFDKIKETVEEFLMKD